MRSPAVLAALLLTGLILLVVLGVWSMGTFVVESEYEVRAMHVTCQLLTDYVRENKAWPRSWENVTDDEAAQKLMAGFSVDMKGMQRFVYVDFQYNMCQQVQANEFTAVRAVKGFYEYSAEVDFRQLIAAAKDVCSGLEK